MDMLRYMSPRFPSLNAAHTRMADFVLGGDCAASTARVKDGEHLIRRQLRLAASLPVIRAFLGLHIRNIVRFGSEEKVSRVEARRIVAPMQNAEASGDQPAPYNPGSPMNRPDFPMNTDLAIAMPGRVAEALPLPAAIGRYLTIRKQAGLDWLSDAWHDRRAYRAVMTYL